MKQQGVRKISKTARLLLLFCMIGIISVSYGFSKKLATVPEVMKAELLRVKNGRFFVTERTSIYIYSLENFKLIKKFGKEGEGPQEFKINPWNGEPLRIEILPKAIFINTIGKVSFFSLDGEFIEEKRVTNIHFILPSGENFLGNALIKENDTVYRTINLYDSDFKKIKEVYRELHPLQEGKKFTMDKSDDRLRVFNDKILISGQKGLVLNIYDKNGQLSHKIEREYKNRIFDNDTRKELHKFLERELKEVYEYVKDNLEFPPYFPPIRNFYSDDQYIYIGTYTETNDATAEFLIFDARGKFLKKVFLPVFTECPVKDYPIDFYQGKLYQIVENEETENWELHVTDVPIK